ncbi:PBP1A family penicillin-binding protein [Bacillus salitolerans]|uniref:PBP1A family penicillin-binding protein n=1 Tax=Bacillus salitolerans TaxID=1437434 RepID=A0ABW4LTS2_9BACI
MAENRTRSQYKKTKNTGNQKKSTSSFFKKLIMALFILGIVGMVAGAVTFYAIVKDAPPIDESQLKDPVSSKVYDMNGNKVAELGIEKRTYVKYQDIPKLVENAFISVEDIRFYDHHGVDLRRLVGAVIANFQEGFGAEGASTITQQVVKNYFLSPEKTIDRKLQEQWLAIKLEQKFSKVQIFEMYVNKIYFSSTSFGQVHGVATAAEAYFGKTLHELELHEAALLAGMPQSPNRYNPFKNPEAAEERRNIVLTLMAKHGFITEQEATAAKEIPVESTLVKVQKDPRPYDSFIDQVIKEVSELGDVDVFSAGLQIYTTLDPEAQAYVENVLNTNDVVQFPNEEFQAGLVLTDTQTGEVRAIGGGRNRQAADFNFATDINRQPGSTIKPIIDYGPAIEYLQWSTYHQIVDEAHTYSNGTPLKNYDNKYKGQMSIREALADSRNIPALKTLQEVGLSKARDFAANLGIPVGDQIYESHSIGGFNGVSPLQLAGAFSSFGNKGVFIKPHTVTKVVFMDKTEVDMKPEPKVVMKESTAFMVTDMMRSVVRSGTGRSANISGLQVAGKTGTTNFDSDTKKKYNIKSGGVPDIWFAGYTPNYTLAVWTGYSKTSETNYILSSEEKAIAKQLFKEIVQHVSEGKEKSDFVKPNNVILVEVEKGSNPPKLPSEFTPKDQIVKEYFIKGTEPKEVSELYQKPEAPTDVSINYDVDLKQLTLTWLYPEELREGITFEVQYSVDEGPFNVLKTTKDLGLNMTNPIKGAIYTFRVTAYNDDFIENRSDVGEVRIEIPAETEIDLDLDIIPDDENDQDQPGNEDENEGNDPGSNEGDQGDQGQNPPSNGDGN